MRAYFIVIIHLLQFQSTFLKEREQDINRAYRMENLSAWHDKVTGLLFSDERRQMGAFTIWMEFSVVFSGQMELHFFATKETK